MFVFDGSISRFMNQVDNIDLKDIQLPKNMQRCMAIVAEAKRQADAKLINANGQLKAAELLTEAAQEMKNPVALQLQWFDVLRHISVDNNSTVIVPNDVTDMMGQMGK